ncbi:MAG TPA: MmcQ/YjbR family DNA-binding protein [Gemmatimonadaceae bacterium]|nr:MmcQ/YjbR family DNA-binding protein [Gemmatimonadaceae bacterium]
MPPRPFTRLRRICLALPEAHEVEAWGEPTYRVRNKIFAMQASADTHHGAGRPAAWIKALPVNQQLLLREDSARYFSPPYVGPSGWIGVHLDDDPDWNAITELLRDGWQLTAPKRLVAAFEGTK